MTDTAARAFAHWMEAAREDLASSRLYETPACRTDLLRRAIICVRLALSAANSLRDQTRCNLCFRTVTWLRAALAAL
jgi:hypothetical protein